MNKNKVLEEYNKKIKLLQKYNNFYFNENTSLVNDDDYDKIKRDIINLENKYNFLSSEKSPTKIVGHKPSRIFKKSLHKVPMLSLANAFSEEDLINLKKNF